MVRAVLIDLDGVVRIWRPERDARAEIAAGLPSGAIRRAAFATSIIESAMRGRVSDERWRRCIVDALYSEHPEADAELAVRLWSESPGEVDSNVKRMIRACRSSASVVLVTNATSRLQLDLRRLELSAEFDGVINSSEIGSCKPHREIYDAALRAAGVRADEALFVDDTNRNVEAARELGMAGHHYRGTDLLRAELARRGLLT